jgi:hypothetical protein
VENCGLEVKIFVPLPLPRTLTRRKLQKGQKLRNGGTEGEGAVQVALSLEVKKILKIYCKMEPFDAIYHSFQVIC